MNRFLALLSVLLGIQPAYACLILVLTSGNHVLVANHEDWTAQDAEVVVRAPAKGRYGFVGFGFASDGQLQGGMNTTGLFFDGTATPFVPLDFGQKLIFNGSIWQALLERCATINEAISFLQRYRLPDLERVHMTLADKSGASVVLGAYDGKLVLHKRMGHSFQLLTNFNLSDPDYGNEPVCERYQMATVLLAADSSATRVNATRILAKTHQGELTVYSNVYDLTTGDVWIYQHADFRRAVRINLTHELRKGSRRQRLSALFAKK
ncbi:linear amide C-N hydrolase [Spirosoma areae]